MNRTIKIISILLIAIALVTVLSQEILAFDYDGVIKTVDNSGTGANMTNIQEKAGGILKTVRNVSAIIAVFVITILGIKYMMGSVEEKAGYKKSFIPLVVGIVVVVAATSIATFLFSV